MGDEPGEVGRDQMRRDLVEVPEDCAIYFLVKEEPVEDFKQESHKVRSYRKITLEVE